MCVCVYECVFASLQRTVVLIFTEAVSRLMQGPTGMLGSFHVLNIAINAVMNVIMTVWLKSSSHV